MRITQRLINENAVRYMSENLERLKYFQERVATGKNFTQASEDPVSAAAAIMLRSQLQTSQAFLNTAKVANEWMTASDLALRQMGESANRAINLTLSGISDTQGAEQRRQLGDEINGILSQAVSLGNTNYKESYIFAGFRTTTRPFELVDADNNGIWESVTYLGDAGVIQQQIQPGQAITQNIDGNGIFSPFFAAMIQARDALYANDSSATQTAMGGLNSALSGLTGAIGNNGARQVQVQTTVGRIEKTQLEIRSMLSEREDVNMAEAISNLQYQETVYQSVLEVGHRAISAMSLFDLLS